VSDPEKSTANIHAKPPVDVCSKGSDMVDTCQENKILLYSFSFAVLVVSNFQGIQGGGTNVTTIDHSDIRGLGTA